MKYIVSFSGGKEFKLYNDIYKQLIKKEAKRMDNMFEELGYGLAEVVWNERDKHLDKNLWDMLDYETAVMCLENQLIDYWTFRYGTGDEYYDDTMTTAEAFIDRMKELAQGTEYDIIEIPNGIKLVKRATPSI